MNFDEYIQGMDVSQKTDDELKIIKRDFFVSNIVPELQAKGISPESARREFVSSANSIIRKQKKAESLGLGSISEYDEKLRANIAKSVGKNLPVVGPVIRIVDHIKNKDWHKAYTEYASLLGSTINPASGFLPSIGDQSGDDTVAKVHSFISDIFGNKKTTRSQKGRGSLEGMTNEQIAEYNEARIRKEEYEKQGIAGLARDIGEGLKGGTQESIVGIAAGSKPFIPATKVQEISSAISSGLVDMATAYGPATYLSKNPIAGFAIPDAVRQVVMEFRRNPEKWDEMDAIEKANYVVTALERVKKAGEKGAMMGAAFSGTGAVVDKLTTKVIGSALATKPIAKAVVKKAVEIPTQAAVMTGFSEDWSGAGYLNNLIIAGGLTAVGAAQHAAGKGVVKALNKSAQRATGMTLWDISQDILNRSTYSKEIEAAAKDKVNGKQGLVDKIRVDRIARFGEELIDKTTEYTGIDRSTIAEKIKTPEGVREIETVYKENRILNDDMLSGKSLDYKTSPELIKAMVKLDEFKREKAAVGDEGITKERQAEWEQTRKDAVREFDKLNGLSPENSGFATMVVEPTRDFKKFQSSINPVINKIKLPDMVNAIYQSPHREAFSEKVLSPNQRNNSNVADILADIAQYSEPERAAAFNESAKTIRGMDGKVAEIQPDLLQDTLTPLGVTPEVVSVVSEILATGKTRALSEAQIKGKFSPQVETLKRLAPDEIDKLSNEEFSTFIKKTMYTPDGRPRTDVDQKQVSMMLKDYLFEKEVSSREYLKADDITNGFASVHDKIMSSPEEVKGMVDLVQQVADSPEKQNAGLMLAKLIEKRVWQRSADLLKWIDKKTGGVGCEKLLQMDDLKNRTTEALQGELEGRFNELFRGVPRKIMDLTDMIRRLEPAEFNRRLPEFIKKRNVSPQDIEFARGLSIELKKISDMQFDMAVKLGMTVDTPDGESIPISKLYREYYSPQLMKDRVSEQGTRENADFLNWLYEAKIASGEYSLAKHNEAAIRNMVKNDFAKYKASAGKHRWGTLEYLRNLPDVPERFLKDTRTRWLSTLEGSANRFSEIMHFGERFEKVDAAILDIVTEAALGLDRTSAIRVVEEARNFAGIITNKLNWGTSTKSMVKALGATYAILKLPKVALSQVMQFTAPIQTGSMRSWLRALKAKLVSEKLNFEDPNGPEGWTARDLFERSGSALQFMRNFGIRSNMFSNKITNAYFKLNGMFYMDGASRAIANATGWFYAEELIHSFNNILKPKKISGSAGEMSPEMQLELVHKKGGGALERLFGAKENTYLVRRLKDLGIDPKTVIERGRNENGEYWLTAREKIDAARNMEVASNYRNYARDLPMFMRNSPFGVLINMFRSFSFNKWTQTKKYTIGEARRGNFFPLFWTMAVDIGLVAPVINYVSSLLSGRKSSVQKLATGKDDYDQDYHALNYVSDILAYSGTLGKWEIPRNMIAFGDPGLGPLEKDFRDLTLAISYSITNTIKGADRSWSPIASFFVKQVPLVGRSVLLKELQESNRYYRGVKAWVDKGYDENAAKQMYEFGLMKRDMDKEFDAVLKSLDRKGKKGFIESELNKAIQEHVQNTLRDLGMDDD